MSPTRSRSHPPLSHRLQREFDGHVRERGLAYQRQGRVHVELAETERVEARVRGSEQRLYRVLLQSPGERAGSRLRVACSCPHAAHGAFCKHLWACLVELDGMPQALAALPAGSLQLAWSDEHEPTGDVDLAWTDALPAGGASDRPRPYRARDGRWQEAEILYVLELDEGEDGTALVVRLLQRPLTPPGEAPGRPRPLCIGEDELDIWALGVDGPALRALQGCHERRERWAEAGAFGAGSGDIERVAIPGGLEAPVVPLLAASGRLAWLEDGETLPLVWDAETHCEARLRLEPAGEGRWCLRGRVIGSDGRDLAGLRCVSRGGLVVTHERIARLAEPARDAVIETFRSRGPIEVEARRLPALMTRLARSPRPPLELPPELGWSERRQAPVPALCIEAPGAATPRGLLYANLHFDYGARRFWALDPTRGWADPQERVLGQRDREHERQRRRELGALGIETPSANARSAADLQLPRSRLAELVRQLVERGWHIEAEGATVRRSSGTRVGVLTGVDWFDLEARAEFGDESASLPALLAAARRGDFAVRLADGSLGLLPDDWLARLAPLAALGEVADSDAVRFRPSQAALLDALLAAEPEVAADELFRRTCARLERARQPRPRSAPAGFRGELRAYQKDGLGWLHHLAELGLGGLLADDMGLGKTVQVLAHLRARRAPSERGAEQAPHLVVVPKSLVQNWLSEAERFAPELRCLEYGGPARDPLRDRFAAHDLIVTTYGVLRRDADKLAGLAFDCLVLDEAQAIKNPRSQVYKAARLLRGEQRIALTGTPVENHLGDLFAIFDFLNPGMLGPGVKRQASLAEASDDTLAALSQALSPFVLRRCKAEVLRELPPKTEQTLVCRLEGRQRREYDELRRHYRNSLLPRVERDGVARTRMLVLEALLRLRQAACHPGLVDPERRDEGSAKLDALIARVEEVVAEGHKALVFSQFTQLLAIVRRRLDATGITYEYLDGRTRKRAERVERFQRDASIPVFLVSLRAGGHGLNLTAADYVFLLDPWWNPAVEAQAIDRSHRIGRSRPVFAYRLIAADTVEEKIVALQQRKRTLADAIVARERGGLRGLTRDDLELLLG